MRITALTLAAALCAGQALAGDISGNYSVQGTNFDGSAYGGTAVIEMTGANTCRISWHGGDSSGICMVTGARVAAYYEFSDGRGSGLVLYDLLPNGTLSGSWTLADSDGLGTETLTPVK